MLHIPAWGGLPAAGLAFTFDAVTFVWVFTALLMLAGFALLLWAIRARDRGTYRPRCPKHGTEATIEVRPSRGDASADVEECSLCSPPTRVECEKRCLRLVA